MMWSATPPLPRSDGWLRLLLDALGLWWRRKELGGGGRENGAGVSPALRESGDKAPRSVVELRRIPIVVPDGRTAPLQIARRVAYCVGPAGHAYGAAGQSIAGWEGKRLIADRADDPLGSADPRVPATVTPGCGPRW